MQRKVTIKKKSPAKKTTPKKNNPNKAKRTPKKEVATQIIPLRFAILGARSAYASEEQNYGYRAHGSELQ